MVITSGSVLSREFKVFGIDLKLEPTWKKINFDCVAQYCDIGFH